MNVLYTTGETLKGSRQGLASAPVSSLLPPIPSNTPPPSLQAQLLAFVANKLYAAPTPRPPAEVAVANLYTAVAAGGLTGGNQPFPALTPSHPTTMRDWTVDKLGMCSHCVNHFASKFARSFWPQFYRKTC